EAEIEQLDAGRSHQNIGRFQIAMRDASRVCGGERIGDLRGMAQRETERQADCHRCAVPKLQDQGTMSVGRYADVIDLAYEVLPQRGNGWGLALETIAELLRRYFDGDIAREPWIVRAIHLAHTARTNERNDFVGTKLVACRQRHRRQGHAVESSSVAD